MPGDRSSVLPKRWDAAIDITLAPCAQVECQRRWAFARKYETGAAPSDDVRVAA